jgi:uncharacterized protein
MQKITVPGPAGQLEVVLHKTTPAAPWLVACHPHPLFAGTMDNKVVTSMVKAAQEAGLNALRFNFRGVGTSEGSYDKGHGEVADLVCVLSWLMEHEAASEFVLAGFSFGSYIAAAASALLRDNPLGDRALSQAQLLRLILIAPPVHHFPFAQTTPFPCVTSIIMGDADEVVPFSDVDNWVGSLYPPAHYSVFEGGGHFFHGRLLELRDWLKEELADL